jgi:uncharacterized RDD family membrane protein YckC
VARNRTKMITQNNIVYAGFWKRVAAFLIDNLLITLVSIVAAGLLFRFAGFDTNQIFFIRNVIYFAALILYWTVMESSSKQATPGKIAVGIKVMGILAGHLGGASWGRWFLRCITTMGV